MKYILTGLMMAVSLCFAAALSLKDRDAIHDDDILRYDEYMATVQDNHAIDMYMDDEEHIIKVDIYDGATDTFEKSASFKPSAQAPTYFEQLDQRAKELLGDDYNAGSTKRSHCLGGINIMKRDVLNFEERASRCYQFCGYGSDCIRASGCTRCRYVGGACRWQKWCI